MSRHAVRTGAAVSPVITTTGTPGTDDQVRTFQDSGGKPLYARPCVVTNMHATEVLYVIPNDEPASATNFMVSIPGLGSYDVSLEGQVAVTKVSLFYVGAAVPYSNVQVRGWLA